MGEPKVCVQLTVRVPGRMDVRIDVDNPATPDDLFLVERAIELVKGAFLVERQPQPPASDDRGGDRG